MAKRPLSTVVVLFFLLCCSGGVYAQQLIVPPGYPPPVRYYNNYIVLKGGIFYPQGDVKELDTGFNGELAVGVQFSRFAAMEIGSGYFDLGHAARASFAGSNLSLNGNIYSIPLTITLKAILPLGRLDLYGLAGGGGYYLHANGTVDTSFGRRSGAMDAAVAGGFLGAGIAYNFTREFFLGLEGKYLWTSNADFDIHTAGEQVDTNFRIEGVQATVNLGFRF
jgi:opacity protein-like surface antigen